MAERGGHITLNGVLYRLDLSSYRGRDIIDFSPRGATPGNSLIHSELGLYQPYLQTTWQGGMGYPWWETEGGYLRTDGQIDTRHEGIAMLATVNRVSNSTATAEEVGGFVEFGGDIFAWTDSGVLKYTSSADTWRQDDPTTGDLAVNWMWRHGTRIFACVNGDRIYYASTHANSTGLWTLTGAGDSSIDYQWLGNHDGLAYAVKQIDGSGLGGNEVYVSDTILLADILGDPTDDPNVLYVGFNGSQVTQGLTYLSDLYFARPDGLFKVEQDRTGAHMVIDLKDNASTANFRSMAVHNGYLVFPVRDEVFQWNGARTSNITPRKMTDTFPYETYGRFDNFVTVGRFLFLSARTNQTTYEEHIICFDGFGWHKLAEPITGGAGSVTSMYYDAVNDRLWYSFNTTASNHEIDYIRFQPLSEFPYADFPTTGTHTLESSRWDAGFRWVTKSSPTIDIEARNLSTGAGNSRNLEIFYSLDGDSFTAWGGSSGTTNLVSTDGLNRLRNPLGSTSGWSTIEYDNIRWRAQFITSTGAQSPILESVTLRLIMRPDEAYGYSFLVVASKFGEYAGGMSDQTAKNVLDNLRTARASKAPVTFIDLWGSTRQVYVSALQEQAIEQHESEVGDAGLPNIESRIAVSLVEVSS